MGNSVDYTKELYEKPSVLKTKSLSMVLDRQVPSRIGNKALEYQGSKVTLPATRELIGRDGENKQYLSTQVRLFLYTCSFSFFMCFFVVHSPLLFVVETKCIADEMSHAQMATFRFLFSLSSANVQPRINTLLR